MINKSCSGFCRATIALSVRLDVLSATFVCCVISSSLLPHTKRYGNIPMGPCLKFGTLIQVLSHYYQVLSHA